MISYEDFMKYAVKIAEIGKERSRSLRGIKHFENGDVIVSDSHRAYLVKHVHHKGETLLSIDGKVLDERYPIEKNVFDESLGEKECIKINVKDALNALAPLVSIIKKKGIHPAVLFSNNGMTYYHEELKATVLANQISFEVHPKVNVLYLYEALELFKDADCETANIHLSKPSDKILFTGSNVKVVILPIRRY